MVYTSWWWWCCLVIVLLCFSWNHWRCLRVKGITWTKNISISFHSLLGNIIEIPRIIFPLVGNIFLFSSFNCEKMYCTPQISQKSPLQIKYLKFLKKIYISKKRKIIKSPSQDFLFLPQFFPPSIRTSSFLFFFLERDPKGMDIIQTKTKLLLNTS